MSGFEDCLSGLSGETNNHTSSTICCLISDCASDVCPICMGLNDPPYMPMRMVGLIGL